MKKRIIYLVGTVIAIAIMGLAIIPHQALATVPGTNSLVSLNSAGTAAANGASSPSQISPDGKYVAFESGATNLVSGDTNARGDIFVRNILSNTITRANLSSSGSQANDGAKLNAISATGRYVLFYSLASNLIDGTTITTSFYQLYLRDTQTNTTYLLSKDSTGNTANASVKGDGVSSDGRFVLFETSATNLATVTNTSTVNLFMLDRKSNTLTVLNTKPDGTMPDSPTWVPAGAMSCDGSFVVFQGAANYTGDPYSHVDIYLLDLRSGKTMTNLTYTANNAALYPSISCNGDYVGFSSKAYNLDTPVSSAQPYWHAYVFNRTSGVFKVVDQNGGVAANTDACFIANFMCIQEAVNISDSGIATFSSKATNLSTGTTAGRIHVYMHNLNTGTTELLTRDSAGSEANQNSTWVPDINARGSMVTYSSGANNLVTTTDTNNSVDVFTSLTGY